MALWSRRKSAAAEAQQDWQPLAESGDGTVTTPAPPAGDRLVRREIDFIGMPSLSNLALQGYPIELVHLEVDRITAGIDVTEEMLVRETITEMVPRAVKPKHGKAKHGKAKAAVEPVQHAAAEGHAYQPQCAALTDDGAQCRNSARAGSDYCASHRGYQPKTTKGLAKRIEGDAWSPDDTLTDRSSVRDADTRPRVRGAKDTKVRRRKAARPTKPPRRAAQSRKSGKSKRRR